jgi:hypothetical protein
MLLKCGLHESQLYFSRALNLYFSPRERRCAHDKMRIVSAVQQALG